MEQVTYLTPNETESENMFEGDIDQALERYPDKLIVTQGALGVFYDGLEQIEIQGIEREVKDTTGGDTFNGALAVGLQKTIRLLKLLHLLMSPLVIQLRLGAQGGMPTINDIAQDLDM